MANWKQSHITAILIFVALSVFLRFFSFFPAVINHDESTYILIGKYLLEGHRYFIDFIDTKPIGIFLFYSGLLALVGKSIFLLRLAVALWVSLTAAGLYVLSLKLSGEKRVAFNCGIIYIFYCSVFTYYGINPNTELIFNGFTVWAFVLALSNRHFWHLFAAGLLLGVGFIIKYVVVTDAMALWILAGILISMNLRKQKLIVAQLRSAILLLLGFLIPIALYITYYYKIEALDVLEFYTLEVPGRYFIEKDSGAIFIFLLDFLGRFFPITIMAVWAWFGCKNSKFKVIRWGLLGWVILDLFIILLPGKQFGHYMIQVMPAMSILAAYNFSSYTQQFKFSLSKSKVISRAMLVLVTLLIAYFHKKDYYNKPDEVLEKAEYISDLLEPGDLIYTGNEHQIIYFLLDIKSPTPYVHRSLLWRDYMIEALDINIEKEIERIQRANPRFMLLQDKTEPDNPMMKLYEDYKVIYEFGDGHLLYERVLSTEY